MKHKNLQNIIKREGQSFVPNVIDDVYASLGISFKQNEKQPLDIEKSLKKEGTHFVPNIIDNVYASCNISKQVNKPDEEIENHLKDEKNSFIPNVKKPVYAAINAKKPRLSFINFITKPATIAFMSAGLIAAIATAVVMPNILSDNSSSSSDPYIIPGEATYESNVNMTIVSASKSFSPDVLYSLQNNGMVNGDKVIPLDDYSNEIIKNINSTSSSKALNSSYSLISFTKTYLTTALNLGYIERKDISKTNEITIEISAIASDSDYYTGALSKLTSLVDDFLYENKVVASVNLALSTEGEETGAESELVILIKQAYEIATRLFMDENGNTISVLCFSNKYEDWLAKYATSSVEEMKAYVDYLLAIDAKISNDAKKYEFLHALEAVAKYQTGVAKLTIEYNKFTAFFKTSLDLLDAKDYPDHPGNPDGFDEDHDDWDWWEDYGHDYHGDKYNNFDCDEKDNYDYNSLDDYDSFMKELGKYEFKLDENCPVDIVLDEALKLIGYLDEIGRFYDAFSKRASETFAEIIDNVENGNYYDNDHQGPGNHYEDEPEGWENDYESWWKDHHGKGQNR